MHRFAVIFAAVFAVLCGGPLVVSAQTVIRVAGESVVERDHVLLGSIASVDGTDASAERLSKLSLGYAPNVGATRQIRREQIALAVRTAGFADDQVRIVSPPIVTVRRPGQIVSESLVRAAIENELLPRFKADNVDAAITRLRIPQNIQVPTGSIDLRVNASSVRNIFVPFSLPVEVRVNGTLVRTFPATCEVEAYAEVFKAARDLPIGASVSDGDLRREKTRLDQPASNYLRDLGALRGAALTRGVWSGSALTRDSIAAVAVIKPGDPIRIEAGSGGMKIIVNGEARTAGRIGDRIAVKNSQTGKILQAFVVDKGIVKVGL